MTRSKATRSSRAPAPLATDAVRAEWLRRIEAEYRSAASTQHLTLWLMQLGAPPDLLELGLRIAGDELVHAELSATVYAEAGGSATPNLARETLQLRRHGSEPLEHDVLRYGVDLFCLGETIAVRLFSRLRASAKIGSAKRALDRILKDEVVHRDFGWTLLEWQLSTPSAVVLRSVIERELPHMLARVRASYGGAALEQLKARGAQVSEVPFHAPDRAWGLMSLAEYLESVDETIERDYRPRFSALGVTLPPAASKASA